MGYIMRLSGTVRIGNREYTALNNDIGDSMDEDWYRRMSRRDRAWSLIHAVLPNLYDELYAAVDDPGKLVNGMLTYTDDLHEHTPSEFGIHIVDIAKGD
jgi:hypothetical protein